VDALRYAYPPYKWVTFMVITRKSDHLKYINNNDKSFLKSPVDAPA